MAEKDAKNLSVRGKIARLSELDKQKLDACMDEIMFGAKDDFASDARKKTISTAPARTEAAQTEPL